MTPPLLDLISATEAAMLGKSLPQMLAKMQSILANIAILVRQFCLSTLTPLQAATTASSCFIKAE